MARASYLDMVGEPRSSMRNSFRSFERLSVQEGARTSVMSFRDGRMSLRETGWTPPPHHDGRYTHIIDSIDEEEEEAEQNMTIRDRVVRLLDSVPFQATMASCIMLNAAVIGGETDYPELEIWKLVENLFLVIFSLELLLRMVAVGCREFFSPGEDQLWNFFDFGIVGLGVFDVACEKFGAQHPEHHHGHEKQKEGGGVSTLFRMIRLLRILRIFKIVRFLKQLYMLAFGFVEAIQAICWVTVLMFFVLYLCSIVMVRTYGRLTLAPSDGDISAVLATQFGNVRASMLSLFELMSNPGNLALYHILMNDFPLLTLFLIAFVIFGSFGMIALLTGVISESMFEKNQTRVQEERQEREQKRELLKQKCVELFQSVEKDEEEEACLKDLEEILPYVREMFEKLDLEYMEHDFENIITMCDIDDSGSISEAEFVSGILSLCDGVRAASIQEVYYLVSQMNQKVKRIECFHDEMFKLTRNQMPDLIGEVQSIMEKLDIESVMEKPDTHLNPHTHFEPHKVETQSELHQLETQHQPQPTSSSNGVDAKFLLQSTETRLSEMKACLASTMDEHAQLLSKKIDDLQVKHTELLSNKIDDLKLNVKELGKRPEPLHSNVFHFGDKDMYPQIGSSGRADIAWPPMLPGLVSAEWESNGKGASDRSKGSGERITPPAASTVRSITPLSPPPAHTNGKSLLE